MTVIDVLREETREALVEAITIAMLDQLNPPYSWNEATIIAQRIVDKVVLPPTRPEDHDAS